MTETEIENLKIRYAEWLDEEQAVGCTEEDIVRTAEPTQNFIDACREYRSVDKDQFENMQVTILEGTQRHKGEARADLYILDAGEFRLVLSM